MSGTPQLSPYEAAWGGLPDTLHPRLRSYFGRIPVGQHGRGQGVFERVGTPRWWLWPILALVGRPDVIFPGWHADVPFTVINRPVDPDGTGRSAGAVAVSAERTFHFAGGDRTMVDAITADGDGLVDYLGSRRRLRAMLEASVTGGALQLTSTRVGLRLGRRWLDLPATLSPRVVVVERFDEVSNRQLISLTVQVPLVGRVYEYAGSFVYELGEGEGPT